MLVGFAAGGVDTGEDKEVVMLNEGETVVDKTGHDANDGVRVTLVVGFNGTVDEGVDKQEGREKGVQG